MISLLVEPGLPRTDDSTITATPLIGNENMNYLQNSMISRQVQGYPYFVNLKEPIVLKSYVTMELSPAND